MAARVVTTQWCSTDDLDLGRVVNAQWCSTADLDRVGWFTPGGVAQVISTVLGWRCSTADLDRVWW
jgi:hypothetical protein